MAQLTLDDDTTAFAEAVRPFLEAREAEYGLLLGMSRRPASLRARWHTGNETLAVALLTSLNLIVSHGVEAASEPLVEALLARGLAVPGIVGPQGPVEHLAAAWARASGATRGVVIEQMLYELRTVVWPTGVAGGMRLMTEGDVDRVSGWIWGFHRDALPHEPFSEAEARENAKARPAQGMTYLWEVDGEPVAMAALARPTRRGITVNAVYTPPEHRRHGYASALTAAVSAEGLARGYDFCVLYTDLANPTSNAIYQAIGYRPVSRSMNIRFG